MMTNLEAGPQNARQKSRLRDGIKKWGRVLIVNKCRRREKKQKGTIDLRQSRVAERNKDHAKLESRAAEFYAEKSSA